MSRLVHKFLENEERSRHIFGTVGCVAGVILLTAAILNTLLAH